MFNATLSTSLLIVACKTMGCAASLPPPTPTDPASSSSTPWIEAGPPDAMPPPPTSARDPDTSYAAIRLGDWSFWARRPTIVYLIKRTSLIATHFIGAQGEVFSVDLAVDAKSWSHGTWRDGALAEMRPSQAPPASWLEQFQHAGGLILLDETTAVAAPPLLAALRAPGEARTTPDERQRLIRLASDHFREHVRAQRAYVGCERQRCSRSAQPYSQGASNEPHPPPTQT